MNGGLSIPVNLGVVMDPIHTINIKKDSTFAILLEAQARQWPIAYLEQHDLYLRDGEARGQIRPLSVLSDPTAWFALGARQDIALASLDVILMRKDPPFDMEYIYATYILERAAQAGVLVINHPQSLRDANEKVYTSWFPHCCPSTLISSQPQSIKVFLQEHQTIVVKPLDRMGGESIFRVTQSDPNVNVILEVMTQRGQRTVMAQRFLPEFIQGDKRILLIDGEPIPYALARLPAPGEGRANLAAGGTGQGVALSVRDQWLCAQVGLTLKEKGLRFVGLDVIGDYLTEINVTSPTGIRELDTLYGLNISAHLLDAIEKTVQGR